LVEMGVLGLLVLLVFLWKYFSTVWKFVRIHKDDDNLYIFFVAQSALTMLWIFASAVFDVTLFNDKVLIYSFLTLGLSGIIIKRYPELK
jgi:hypothetical protein